MHHVSSMLLDTPAGRLYLASDAEGICEVRAAQERDTENGVPCGLLEEAAGELLDYFAGRKKRFDVPLSLHGTDFERSVWQALLEIPFGEVRSYGQIAAQIGKSGAARAVGGACSRNPVLIIVPCHRVVAASGALTGFAAGMDMKRRLLAHEGWQVFEKRIGNQAGYRNQIEIR